MHAAGETQRGSGPLQRGAWRPLRVSVARKEARPRQRCLRLLFLCYVDPHPRVPGASAHRCIKKPSLCSVSPSRKRRRCVMFSPTLLLSGALVVMAEAARAEREAELVVIPCSAGHWSSCQRPLGGRREHHRRHPLLSGALVVIYKMPSGQIELGKSSSPAQRGIGRHRSFLSVQEGWWRCRHPLLSGALVVIPRPVQVPLLGATSSSPAQRGIGRHVPKSYVHREMDDVVIPCSAGHWSSFQSA
jgi:hypothetical protein